MINVSGPWFLCSLNVSGPCDLRPDAIIKPLKCQDPRSYASQDICKKLIRTPNKYQHLIDIFPIRLYTIQVNQSQRFSWFLIH